jgi:hypothetical protein
MFLIAIVNYLSLSTLKIHIDHVLLLKILDHFKPRKEVYSVVVAIAYTGKANSWLFVIHSQTFNNKISLRDIYLLVCSSPHHQMLPS